MCIYKLIGPSAFINWSPDRRYAPRPIKKEDDEPCNAGCSMNSKNLFIKCIFCQKETLPRVEGIQVNMSGWVPNSFFA